MARRSDLASEVHRVMEEAGLETVPGNPNMLDEARRKKKEARRIEAMSLVLAGLTYEQVGQRLDITASAARSLVERTLERTRNRNADELRELENQRLDRAQAAIWTKVLEGDLKAVDTYLKISARRGRLNGLDAPTNINLSIGIRQEMEQALDELHQVVMGEVIGDDDGDTGPGYGSGDDLEVEGSGGDDD